MLHQIPKTANYWTTPRPSLSNNYEYGGHPRAQSHTYPDHVPCVQVCWCFPAHSVERRILLLPPNCRKNAWHSLTADRWGTATRWCARTLSEKHTRWQKVVCASSTILFVASHSGRGNRGVGMLAAETVRTSQNHIGETSWICCRTARILHWLWLGFRTGFSCRTVGGRGVGGHFYYW